MYDSHSSSLIFKNQLESVVIGFFFYIYTYRIINLIEPVEKIDQHGQTVPCSIDKNYKIIEKQINNGVTSSKLDYFFF